MKNTAKVTPLMVETEGTQSLRAAIQNVRIENYIEKLADVELKIDKMYETYKITEVENRKFLRTKIDKLLEDLQWYVFQKYFIMEALYPENKQTLSILSSKIQECNEKLLEMLKM